MQVTFLVGNGFDLNAGLRTRFSDFFKVYCEETANDTPVIKKFKEEIGTNVELWSDFEKQMGAYTSKVTKDIPEEGKLSIEDYYTCIDDFRNKFIIYLNEEIQRPTVLIMKDQIYEPIERSRDVAVKAVVMSQQFLDGMIHDIGEVHPLRGSVYRNPVVYTDSIRHVFNMYYEMLLNIAKSQHLKYKEQAARHLTLSMFYGHFCDKHLENGPKRRSRQEEIFADFLDLLHPHHKKERLVAFYADKLCITPKYLSKIVKDLTKHTALEYIEEYVITEAKSLLNATNMAIQQISNELNFPSQSVFGKYFRRVTHMSPKEYRSRSGME